MKNWKGIPCSEESLKEWIQTWIDIELAINNLMDYDECQEVHNETTRKGILKNEAL